MPPITPCLWFDGKAEQAVEFYTAVFNRSSVGAIARYGKAGSTISGNPEGSVMTIRFELEGTTFLALNGGPEFTFTPAISFHVACQTDAEIEHLWARFSENGTILMPLGEYPFSPKFGWLQDPFGVSWQFNLIKDTQTESTQKITPVLMFANEQYGKAETAMCLYTSLFPNAGISQLTRADNQTVQHATFLLDGQAFMAMDSPGEHPFTFSLATSLIAYCHNQAELDRLWETLSKDGEAGHCGWLQDPFGVSWQIVPTALDALITDTDTEKAERVMQRLLQMKKLDISQLEAVV